MGIEMSNIFFFMFEGAATAAKELSTTAAIPDVSSKSK